MILKKKIMSRDDNVVVFRDTERMCKENDRLKELIRESVLEQKLILENDVVLNIKKKIYEEPANVIVSGKSSYVE